MAIATGRPETPTAGTFGSTIRAHLERVEAHNAPALDEIARRMLDVVRNERLIYTTGTGHSIALVLESFYRAGGLACVQPLYHASLLPLHGGLESTLCEHTTGLADLVIAHYAPGAGDLAFVFSNSGVNAVPVEMADALHAKGATVVGVLSRQHLSQARPQVGHTLADVADHVLDTLVPYGDAAYPVGDGVATAGLSSVTGVYLWDLLLARLADLARADGVRLPVWTSSNVEGGIERNRELFGIYQPRVPTL
jgi:uncharacterized phosphosugar-binding protein